MITDVQDQTYKFNVKNIKYEVFFADDNHIEIYKEKDPGKTGFIFNSIEELSMFDNDLADIIDMKRRYIQ